MSPRKKKGIAKGDFWQIGLRSNKSEKKNGGVRGGGRRERKVSEKGKKRVKNRNKKRKKEGKKERTRGKEGQLGRRGRSEEKKHCFRKTFPAKGKRRRKTLWGQGRLGTSKSGKTWNLKEKSRRDTFRPKKKKRNNVNRRKGTRGSGTEEAPHDHILKRDNASVNSGGESNTKKHV